MVVVGAVPRSAEVDLAKVGSVAQHRQNTVAGPGFSRSRAEAALVELFGDLLGPQTELVEDREHVADVEILSMCDLKLLRLAVELVSVRRVASAPLALSGLAFHGVNDPVDEDLALELGEHAGHLDQHAADCAGGVDGLGC
ncbi:MAG TPA: hypothetical protein VFC19_30845 [Candidatus Limnocylindrales bacterium]|nr:hypothetical protein [Candidatus Limnocylindrales bacterium]